MEASKISLLIIVAIVFAVIFTLLFIVVLIAINEESRKRCGNCAAFDRDLRICWWDRTPHDDYTKGCVHHEREEKP